MMMRAPENRTRLISTRCCMPIGNEPVRARGSTSRPRPRRCSVEPRGTSDANRRRRGAPRLLTEKDVLRHCQVGNDAEFLVDHANARGPERHASRRAPSPPSTPRLALVGRVHAGDDLHQCALAGAVLTDEPMDFVRAKREVDLIQSRHAADDLEIPVSSRIGAEAFIFTDQSTKGGVRRRRPDARRSSRLRIDQIRKCPSIHIMPGAFALVTTGPSVTIFLGMPPSPAFSPPTTPIRRRRCRRHEYGTTDYARSRTCDRRSPPAIAAGMPSTPPIRMSVRLCCFITL